MSDALVLAGGFVKGAFAAGALSVLSDPAVSRRLGLDITRIVCASVAGHTDPEESDAASGRRVSAVPGEAFGHSSLVGLRFLPRLRVASLLRQDSASMSMT